jgi:type I site-specific restriction endonuclease
MEDVDKKELSERDICTKFITPAIKQANWRERQIREEVKLTNGRIIVSILTLWLTIYFSLNFGFSPHDMRAS